MQQHRIWLAVLLLGVAATAVAQDDEAPDVAFLEYLGSWQDSDEDWLIVAEQMLGESVEEVEDAPEAGPNEPAETRRDDAKQDDDE
jgi:hypothetical protein